MNLEGFYCWLVAGAVVTQRGPCRSPAGKCAPLPLFFHGFGCRGRPDPVLTRWIIRPAILRLYGLLRSSQKDREFNAVTLAGIGILRPDPEPEGERTDNARLTGFALRNSPCGALQGSRSKFPNGDLTYNATGLANFVDVVAIQPTTTGEG